MLATRSLKITLFVVGFLVVGLGLYAAFQVQEAEATHSSISCLVKEHNILSSSSITVTGSSYTGKTRIKKKIKCGDCYGTPWPPADHVQNQKIIYFDYVIDYEHRYPFGAWSFCHTHSGSSSREQWVTVRCGKKALLPDEAGSSWVENSLAERRRFI